ncbi:MAG TPA: glycosyl hydrolase [Puia sp.]|nr:glycosyl hydrolase [Puia sp.]
MTLNRRQFIQTGSFAALGTIAATSPAAALGSSLFSTTLNKVLSDLTGNFISPPASVKSSCYWWWFNGLVDKEGITRDLEEFHSKGMGEVLLVNSAGGLGGVPFPQGARLFSEEWKELYRHAMSEAKRLDIAVGINLCSGWCMGGPWITPGDSGRWYLQSELDIRGPQTFSGQLPLPGNRAGYDKVFNPPGYKGYIDLPLEKLDYRDTAVVAIPCNIPGSDASLGSGTTQAPRITGPRATILDAKTNHRDASNFIMAVDVMKPLLEQWRDQPGDNPVKVETVIDLTGKMDEHGHLQWEVPPGKWKVIRTGHRMTGSRLMIAQPEADGLSVDWFNRRGVELQFEHLGKLFIEEAAKVGNKPKYFCDDSFEDGFPNWTENILDQFKKYRGYDATPYLPVLSGYLIGSAAISDRFLNDYRKTLGDCMADEHYKRFADLCHEHGMLVQNEASGPSRSGTMCMDGLKNQGRSDLPMGEFWLGLHHEDESTLADNIPYGTSRLDKGQNKVTKMAASAGHTYGHNIISAEAFTSFRHWLDYPGSLKQALDRAYCEGINRIAIHTSTATRPRDGKPGYEYGAGTHFNPNVTWWEMSKPFFDYVGRCQYLLRSGHFCADVLYYNGDTTPNLVAQKHLDPSLGLGYDYDVCNEEVLLTRLSCVDGKLTLPDDMHYEVLVLPDTTRMPLKVLKKIAELVDAGAAIIGPQPTEDSGLVNYPECDNEIKTLSGHLWNTGRIRNDLTIRETLAKKNIAPDFEYTGRQSAGVSDRHGDEVWLDFIHRTTPEAEIYFITNRHGKTVSSDCSFRITDHTPQLWNPVDGSMHTKLNYKLEKDRLIIPLKFEAFQSWFVIFPKNTKLTPAAIRDNFPEKQTLQTLTGPWDLAFDPQWGGPANAKFDQLQDWSTSDDDRIKYYSGKAIYTKTFDLQPIEKGPIYLDLGIVKNIARVILNGHDLGIIWTAPWQVDLSPALRTGANELRIEVINLWPNRLIGDAALPPEKRLTNTNIQLKKDAPLLPSGLLGPVTLQTTPRANDALYAAFLTPANTAKPFVRWWWNGLRIVREELIRELDMLRSIGVGGVEINSIRFPDTADPMNYKELAWLSPEWVDLVQFAVDAAHERDMQCDIIMGSGWPFGGEFLTGDEQTQLMSLGTRDIVGPQKLTLSRAELVKSVDPPVSFKNPNSVKELKFMRLVPAELNTLSAVVDLDSQVTKDTITIDVPPGKHVLYFLVNITGYMNVIYGAPGAAGPVLNHYNKQAVEKYLDRMSDAFKPKKLGDSFRSVFTDSMELQGANWCLDMPAQFQKRRGYDITPFLPFILFKTGAQGRHIKAQYGATFGKDLDETLERVRYDFEITKMDLFREHFLDVFLDWCRKNGVRSRVQAYGREYYPLDSSLDVDIPECETWLRSYVGEPLKDFDYRSGRAYSQINKFVSSAAHLSGKRITSCEEITNTEVVFNASLERIKQTGDQSNITGVTHSILHGFNYSPKDAPFPGWIRYGCYFNERNTWWPYLHRWIAYKARLSAVFQNGDMIADIAVLPPLADLWGKYTAQWDPFPELAYPDYLYNIWEAIHQNGSGCDYVTELILQNATFDKGNLIYGPRKYKALIIVEVETMHPATANALQRYAEAGGRIIFIEKYPDKAPGYLHHETGDAKIRNTTAAIKKHTSLHPAPTRDEPILQWYRKLQKKYNLDPYVKIDKPQPMVSQIAYHSDKADAFFFNNFSNTERYAFNAEFAVPGNRSAWVWNPETGERFLYPATGKKNNRLHLTLGPAETLLIVFDPKTDGETYIPLTKPGKPRINIDTPWSLTLDHYNGTQRTIRLEKLTDFRNTPALAAFAGAAIYENEFEVKNAKALKTLDLGKVDGITEATLNGIPLGIRWYGDHVYAVGNAIKPGRNKLSIKLVTTLGNYMLTSLKENKDTIKWLINKKQSLYPHGIMGPVILA